MLEYFVFFSCVDFARTPTAGRLAAAAADDGWKASKRELLNLLNCFLNNYDEQGNDHLDNDDDPNNNIEKEDSCSIF